MRRFRTLFVGSVIALSITALVLPAQAQSGTVTAQVDGSGFSTSTQTAQDVLDNRLLGAMGTVEVVVRLGDAPLTQALRARATNERTAASSMSRDQQQAYVADLERDQDGLLAQMQSLGAKEIGRLTHALNAVILSVDAAQLPTIAGMAGVTSVNPLVHYELADREVNDAIGATAAIESGVTGRGVKVAVFDSGIDYTHKELSGPGTLEAYARAYCGNEAATAPFSPACGTAYNNPAPADLFPSAKVYGGFDFVGEVWPNGPGGFSDADRSEDPNPLDLEGHGTHVADIVAGREGVAPNAQLLAVKVCSAVSGSCNGVALLKGVEFALDPNGDGSISDAVDVFNLSLSSSYGQIDDDLSLAVANATQLGVVVVASAGNQGDRPYIHGSPAATPGVIGVAQTTVPSASALFIKTPAIPTGVQVIPQSWAAAPIAQAAPLTYIATNLGTQRGCTDAQGTSPFTAGQLAGQIVLVDRGGCPISFKAANVARAGGVAMVLANNVAQGPFDPPPSFSFAGDDAAKTIPVYSITLAAGNLLKSNSLNQNAQVDPATAANVFGSVVTTSSRGPNNSFNAIKPDISAPGASVSAIAGSGTNREPFGGTSGAAPVVAGSAALLLEKFPEATPREVAARLMNTASPAIQINPAVAPGVLAPVARIGAGEVRPNAALNATTMAFAIDPIFNLPFASSFPASLSFGYHAVSEPITLRQRLLIQNLSDRPRSYTISSGFRSRNGTGVTLETPERVRIGPGGRRLVTVRLRIDPTDLPEWTMNGGVFGGDGFRLNGIPAGIPGVEAVPGLETDGYLTISSGSDDTISVPWHVLPRRAATTAASPADGGFALTNSAPTPGGYNVFALTGTGPAPTPDQIGQPGEQNPDINLKAVGVRLANVTVDGTTVPALQFAINTWQTRAHPNAPARFNVIVDNNRDGTPDFVVFTQELGGVAQTGQNFTFVRPANSSQGSGNFFTDADLNSGNAILTVPLAQLGLTPGSTFNFTVQAEDISFTNSVKSAIGPMTFTPNTPRFALSSFSGVVPAGSSTTIVVEDVSGGAEASPSQQGLLVLYRNKAPGTEAEAITFE